MATNHGISVGADVPDRRVGRPRLNAGLEPAILALLSDPAATYRAVAESLGTTPSHVRSVANRSKKANKPPAACTDEGADTEALSESQCTDSHYEPSVDGESSSEAA